MTSIRWRMVTSYTLVVLFTVIVLSAALFWAIDGYYNALERRYLAVNAQGAAEVLSPLLARQFPLHQVERQVSLLAFLSQARVRVWRSDGTLIADSGSPSSQPLTVALADNAPSSALLTQTVPAAGVLVQQVVVSDATNLLSLNISMNQVPFGYVLELQGDKTGAFESLSNQARSHQVMRVPVWHKDQLVGEVELLEGPAYSRQIVGDVAEALLKVTFGVALAGAAAGALIGSKLLTPLLELAGAVRQMSRGELSTRAAVRGRDEVAMLAGRFNAMADHIQQTLSALEAERESLRRFTADASHEMRTPLTALASFIDLMGGPRGTDHAARAELLAQSEQQVARLNRLMGDLLELAHFDSGTAKPLLRTGDLRDVVRREVNEGRLKAGSRGITLEMNLPDAPVTAQFDRTYFSCALGNLIDNAIKFSSTGKVCVGLQTNGQTANVWVSDEGPGISPSDLPHIFERFYRGHSTQDIPGTGLGLAIVAAIAQMHAGRVTVQSEQGAGSRFVLEIPLCIPGPAQDTPERATSSPLAALPAAWSEA